MNAIQRGAIVHGVIHHAASTTQPTDCGVIGPAAADWRYVDCFRCLAKKHEPIGPRPELAGVQTGPRSTR